MYCPKCRTEYREGFAQCADCLVPLVSESALGALKAEPEFVDIEEVLTTIDPGEIALIKSLLDAEEIPYLAQGEHSHSLQSPIPVRFLVPKAHVVRAREVLEDLL
jgi:Putative prokaryotic signal transducing protein